MDKGDFLRRKDGTEPFSLIWEITVDDMMNARFGLEWKTLNGLGTFIWVSYYDANQQYIKVTKDGNPIEEQLTLFGGSNQHLGCFHEWREYTGFTESYQYCAKCDKKQGTRN
jgi:hypothetical protein